MAKGFRQMSFGIFDEQTICSRKQSASDLQSRLKTRKLLGVGELAGDNGEIYRSKISQLLGINESLYVKLPMGLMYWNTFNALYFYLVGAMFLILPGIAAKLELGILSEGNQVINEDTHVVARMYGALLISFGLLFRSILAQRETRAEIATLLLVTAFMHIMQVGVICMFRTELISVLIHLIFIFGNLAYHSNIDSQGGLHRQFMRFLDDFSLLATPVMERPPERRPESTTTEKTEETKPDDQKKDE